MLADIIVHPVDTIKTMQVANSSKISSIPSISNEIYRGYGIQGFYSGAVIYSLTDAFAAASKFVLYEYLKLVSGSFSFLQNESVANFFYAAVAGLAYCLVLVPGEVLKQQQQAVNANPFSVFYGASAVYNDKGLRGFWTGLGCVLLRAVPYTVIELGFYDLFKSIYSQLFGLGDNYEKSQFDLIMIAAFVGVVAGGLSTPFDNIKTKLIAGNYSSLAECVSYNVQTYGIHSMFDGGLARICWLFHYLQSIYRFMTI